MACIACVLIATAACNNKGSTDTDGRDTTNLESSRIESREEDFVRDALEDNIEQKAWINEAMSKATDPEIKSTAREMMQENEKMQARLTSYATKKNFSTAGIDSTIAVTLGKKQGVRWDAEWADEVGDRQRQCIRRFERAQNRVEDRELQDIIAQSLPMLRSRLDQVERLEARLDDIISPIVK
jgi:predicted outer membrane protein